MSDSAARATSRLHAGLGGLGYGPDRLIDGFEFSDVGTADAGTRSVRFAAFTHSPPSYRSAAFGVVEGDLEGDAEGRLGWLGSLGAPVVFLVAGASVEVLKIGRLRTITKIESVSPEDVQSFVESQRAWWTPDAMRRFKLFGAVPAGAPQFDFFDAGLLPAIEAQTQRHLAATVEGILDELRRDTNAIDRPALSVVFRMLAAKVLLDRHHPEAAAWGDDAEGILEGIGSYYELASHAGFDQRLLEPGREVVSAAWSRLKSSMSLRNVSSDDLAFVYENSFVSEQVRVDLNTYSTPRSVAEYACDRLPFEAPDPQDIRIFEPFAGAGVFLIAAVRRMADRVADLTPADRHAFLVERVRGCDIDEFACQVAQLSLILADYPNRNNWQVEQRDLFASPGWLDGIDSKSIVFCNPPYGKFTAGNRADYGVAIGNVPTKAIWAAHRIVSKKPAGLALVLPRGFLLAKGYGEVRAEVEKSYGDIEVLALPEHTFARAGFETCLLIGKSLRKATATRTRASSPGTTRVTNAFVARADLPTFHLTRTPSWERITDLDFPAAGPRAFWAGDLEPIWKDLQGRCEPLATHWEVHRGIEWLTALQERAWSPEQKPGSRPGYHPNEGMMAFEAPMRGWLDVRPEHIRRNAHLLPWQNPKVLLNAARRSRDRWRLTAFVERADLAASQQFIGLWPKEAGFSLEALAAVLNGPVANAFLGDLTFAKHLTLEDVKKVPLPRDLEKLGLDALVLDYTHLLREPGFDAQREDVLRKALLRIDAAVLTGYDLPPRMERLLLRQFTGRVRQVPFRFDKFYPDAVPALPLRDIVGGVLERAQWPLLAPAFERISQADGDAVWGNFG